MNKGFESVMVYLRIWY
jgi:hypothetical protein